MPQRRQASRRFLATVLFTDIVGSTQRAAELGDHAWRNVLERHNAIVRRELKAFQGREMDTAGDGFFAVFEAPERAVRCAESIVLAVVQLGIDVRAGVHMGECEQIGGKVGGMAVTIGARIAALAEAGEVLVSGSVRDLMTGSDRHFEGGDLRELKGSPMRGGCTGCCPGTSPGRWVRRGGRWCRCTRAGSGGVSSRAWPPFSWWPSRWPQATY